MFNDIKEKFESKLFIIISSTAIGLSLILLILKSFSVIKLNDYIDFAWITIIISGYPIIYEAIEELKEKHISSELLVTIALIASIIIGEVFAAGEVCFIMSIGEILEDLTVEKANKGLNKLVRLMPNKALLIKDDDVIETPIESIKVNDLIRVLPGERIALDGIIIKGNTSIDQSILTGESIPVDKGINDYVYQGTINIQGSIDFKVLKEAKDTTLNKMVELIKESENNQAPIKRTADKWASILVPASLLVAILTGIFSYIILKDMNESLIRAVTILVTFCPCALTISTPTAVMAGIGQAAKNGVLIKSGAIIEETGRTNLICFDKTGTLTKAELKVSDIISLDNKYTNKDIINIASSLESKSEHPLGKAIVKYAVLNNITLLDVDKFKSIPGKGIIGSINNIEYKIGSINYLKKELKDYTAINKLLDDGKGIILLSTSDNVIGIIALEDTLRDNALKTIEKLNNLNYKVNLLTGDNKKTANHIAEKLNIKNIYSELLPIDKVNIIKDLNSNGYKTVMVGDGVNDAPSLKTANIGIALGGISSDITTDSASIVILDDNIEKIPYILKLSKLTLNTIKFNITISIIINIIAVILSIAGLLNPITGAIVHNIGSVLVVLNAAILIDRKIK